MEHGSPATVWKVQRRPVTPDKCAYRRATEPCSNIVGLFHHIKRHTCRDLQGNISSALSESNRRSGSSSSCSSCSSTSATTSCNSNRSSLLGITHPNMGLGTGSCCGLSVSVSQLNSPELSRRSTMTQTQEGTENFIQELSIDPVTTLTPAIIISQSPPG